jgi:hypothetical protein
MEFLDGLLYFLLKTNMSIPKVFMGCKIKTEGKSLPRIEAHMTRIALVARVLFIVRVLLPF